MAPKERPGDCMARRSLGFWILLVLLLAAMGSALAVTGYVLVKSRRGQEALLRAEQAYAEGRWIDAKTNYTWYLVRHPEDSDVRP